MSVFYTVHAPPLRPAEAAPDPERFVFVRDGFYLWAFLAAALWMLWHRMWLVLVLYLVVAAGLETAMTHAGVPAYVVGVVGLFISLLIGIEASTLRRFTLARRGWKNVGVVGGHDREDAERRFFSAWVHEGAEPQRERPAPPPAPPGAQAQRMPGSTDVIGLFPEPGVSR